MRRPCLWDVVGGSGVGVWLMEAAWSVFQPAGWLPLSGRARAVGHLSSRPSLLSWAVTLVFVLMSASLSVPPGAVVTAARACHTRTFARGLKVQQEAALP